MDKSVELEDPAKAAEVAKKAVEKKPLDWDKICSILIMVTAALAVLMVLLQALEIDTYELFPTIGERLAAIFQ